MSKSKNFADKLAKLIETGMGTSKDINDEIKNNLKFKQEEITKKLNFVSKEEFEIQKMRLDKLEEKFKEAIKKKTKKVKKS